jgi:hypothetical protein
MREALEPLAARQTEELFDVDLCPVEDRTNGLAPRLARGARFGSDEGSGRTARLAHGQDDEKKQLLHDTPASWDRPMATPRGSQGATGDQRNLYFYSIETLETSRGASGRQ